MKNPEELIGRKVRGFKFEEFTHAGFTETMESFIGKDGIIESYNKNTNCFLIIFDLNNAVAWAYPADQIEAHLVVDEIPTFTKEDLRVAYKSGFNLVKKNKECDGHFERWYQKKYDPTKEEQLTAILGSSEKVSEIMELFKKP